MEKFDDGKPVADFYCSACREEFELKSKRDAIGMKLVDGAYRTMIERLQSVNNPNFFLLSYDALKLEVINFLVIPKHFFVREIIEKRKPLATTARRAGWVGCNILLQSIPAAGKIFYVKNRVVQPQKEVLSVWSKTLFLRKAEIVSERGWLLDVMLCVDRLGKKEFSLDEMYSFENYLSAKHPANRHVRDKIRQQMQVLRDKGYLKFVSRGRYCAI